MVGEGFPEIKFAIQTVMTLFSTVVLSIGTISGFTNSLLNSVLQTLAPLVTCATTSLGL
jgi:hypothetical protein